MKEAQEEEEEECVEKKWDVAKMQKVPKSVKEKVMLNCIGRIKQRQA